MIMFIVYDIIFIPLNQHIQLGVLFMNCHTVLAYGKPLDPSYFP